MWPQLGLAPLFIAVVPWAVALPSSALPQSHAFVRPPARLSLASCRRCASVSVSSLVQPAVKPTTRAFPGRDFNDYLTTSTKQFFHHQSILASGGRAHGTDSSSSIRSSSSSSSNSQNVEPQQKQEHRDGEQTGDQDGARGSGIDIEEQERLLSVLITAIRTAIPPQQPQQQAKQKLPVRTPTAAVPPLSDPADVGAETLGNAHDSYDVSAPGADRDRGSSDFHRAPTTKSTANPALILPRLLRWGGRLLPARGGEQSVSSSSGSKNRGRNIIAGSAESNTRKLAGLSPLAQPLPTATPPAIQEQPVAVSQVLSTALPASGIHSKPRIASEEAAATDETQSAEGVLTSPTARWPWQWSSLRRGDESKTGESFPEAAAPDSQER
ncbi:unnamed protein product, partial [Sphacelaria rigidula]